MWSAARAAPYRQRVAGLTAERALDRLAELANRQHDLAGFWREATDVLSSQVPYFWTPCWYTLDPASLLITSHFHEGLDVFPEEWLTAEYYEDDVNQIIEVVRSERGLSTLHELTGGDPTGTPRWQANIQLGGDQELIVRLGIDGETWGALGLYREPGSPMFSASEESFLLAAAPHLAQGARRALLFGECTDPEWPDGPGLVVVTAGGELVSATDAAAAWLHLLPGDGSEVPDALRSVAHQAVTRPMQPAEARVPASNGSWVQLRAARFVGEDRVAVIVEPAHPARIFELMMSAHGLTARERDVVRLVLEGQSTEQMSRTLSVSAHTVQQHLKSVFDRMGVHSRRELVAQAFFTHYAPRFRDNETRTTGGDPIRGEPASPRRENRTNPKVSPSTSHG
jgi:DNA-binding CsgD family transcriptional regulator